MGLRQRWLAFVFARGNKVYESKVEERKRALLGGLRGTVVEIGPGAGANLQYLDASVRWIGFEPNPHMRGNLVKEAARLGRAVDLRPGPAERMDLDDGTADAVVCTLVLCSVPDVDALLREARRVLKPGGEFVFVEHVAAPRGTLLRAIQRLVKPLWRCVNDGCDPERETGAALERAFADVRLDSFRVRFPIVSPHIAGVARTMV
jgi:SAM-dependent methyltransferase